MPNVCTMYILFFKKKSCGIPFDQVEEEGQPRSTPLRRRPHLADPRKQSWSESWGVQFFFYKELNAMNTRWHFWTNILCAFGANFSREKKKIYFFVCNRNRYLSTVLILVWFYSTLASENRHWVSLMFSKDFGLMLPDTGWQSREPLATSPSLLNSKYSS